PRGRDIILFDGVCVLCSRGYRFVSTRDSEARFRFVAIQSPEGRAIAERCGIDADNPDTFALVTNDKVHVRSDAVLRILGSLPAWRWTVIFRVIPERLRDKLYDVVARNRYRWFGRLDACMVPDTPRT